jgi:hypothetical protein
MKSTRLVTLLLVMSAANITSQADPINDASLTAALLGTWEVMQGPSAIPYGEVIYTNDGRLSGFNSASIQHGDGSVQTEKVKMRGQWSIKDDVLVITNLESDPVGHFPSVPLKRYLIRSITSDEAFFKDLSDGSNLYRRRKKRNAGLKV